MKKKSHTAPDAKIFLYKQNHKILSGSRCCWRNYHKEQQLFGSGRQENKDAATRQKATTENGRSKRRGIRSVISCSFSVFGWCCDGETQKLFTKHNNYLRKKSHSRVFIAFFYICWKIGKMAWKYE